MITIHVHSKFGHDGVVQAVIKGFAYHAASLDPMPDGSTVSALGITQPHLIPTILQTIDGLTLIPRGVVGPQIAQLLIPYNIQATQTKKEVLATLFAAQPNTSFHPSIMEV